MPAKEVSIFDITEFSLGRKFGLLGRLYFSVLSKKLEHLGLEKHFSVLVLLDKMGEHCTQKFIANALHIDKTMMVGVLDDLGKKGFIKRTQNPSDRREYWIQLTPRAKAHMPEIRKVVNTLNKEIMKGLDAEEVKNFHKYLGSIYRNVKRISQK